MQPGEKLFIVEGPNHGTQAFLLAEPAFAYASSAPGWAISQWRGTELWERDAGKPDFVLRERITHEGLTESWHADCRRPL